MTAVHPDYARVIVGSVESQLPAIRVPPGSRRDIAMASRDFREEIRPVEEHLGPTRSVLRTPHREDRCRVLDARNSRLNDVLDGQHRRSGHFLQHDDRRSHCEAGLIVRSGGGEDILDRNRISVQLRNVPVHDPHLSVGRGGEKGRDQQHQPSPGGSTNHRSLPEDGSTTEGRRRIAF